MKKDTLFEHKKVATTCEESMADANEYQKMLEPLTKHEKVSKGKQIDAICAQCNKQAHSKERSHWNPNNPKNKLKDRKEVTMNGVLAQIGGGTRNKFDNKGHHGDGKKIDSIIYCYFNYNYVEHKIYDYPHKYAT